MSRDGEWTPLSVDRPVATFMVVLAVSVFGYVSLRQLPVDLMPELSYPTITVRTGYPGAAPEEVEDEITDPLEEYLGTVEGVVGIRSVSRAGSSDVVLRFQWNTGLDFAMQKIRERLALIEFPDVSDPPMILRYDPTLDPILRIAVHGDRRLSEIRHYADEELEPALEKIIGVAMVRVLGGEEEIVRVAVDERRLDAYGLDIAVIADRLRNENVNVAGGRLYEGEVEYIVRTVNEFGTVDDIANLVVAVRPAGVVRLRDVADVGLGVRDREIVTRVDSTESIELAIFKEADANLVAVAEAVKAALFGPDGLTAAPDGGGEGSGDAADDDPAEGAAGVEDGDEDGERAGHSDRRRGRGSGDRHGRGHRGDDDEPPLAAQAPSGLEIVVLSDQSAYVRAAIAEVANTALLGGLCAIVVIFFFLRRVYPTFVIGLAIPLSVIATFAPLRWLGVSVNIMSLGGLALGIGMLVDNAIVVLESIVRCREEGDGVRDAAVRGTREVGGAVVASTLTTVAVFFPIVFIDGIAGQLFSDLGAAVVLSLLASLAFALFFVPMMATLPARLGLEAGAAADGWRGPARAPGDMLRRAFRLSSIAATRDAWRSGLGLWRRGGLLRRAAAIALWLYSIVRALLWVPVEIAVRLVWTVFVALGLVVGALVRLAWRALAVVFGPLGGGIGWSMAALQRGYRRGLVGALRVRIVVIAVAAGCLYWAATLWPMLGLQLIPELEQGEFTAAIQLPVGTRLEETVRVVSSIEAALSESPDVARISTFVGRNDDDIDASQQGEHYAELTVVVAGAGEDRDAEERAVDALRLATALQPAVTYEVRRPTLFSLDAPISVEVRGHRLEPLRQTAGEVEARIRATAGVRDVRSNMREGYPEVRVRFNRERLAALGLDLRVVAEEVRSKVQGSAATELRTGERSIDVEVAVRASEVTTVDDLRRLVVGFVESGASSPGPQAALGLAPAIDISTGRRQPIRLGAVADVALARGPAEIRHVDGQRAAVISAGTSLLDVARTVDVLRRSLRTASVREGQVVVVGGQSEEMEAATRSLAFALLLAVFLVYVVMASKFESLMGPLVILSTFPLALVGVVWVLAKSGTPVSVVVLIGVIVLAGIVVNNAIVLVDYVLQLRRRGLPKREAIAEACSVRLRPVLITAATTVLGLLPMALGWGEGAEIRRPLAWVVIAGLTASTLLTLVVVPVAYDVVGELLGAPRGGRTDP